MLLSLLLAWNYIWNIDPENPLNYEIQVVWFPYNSDANKRANKRYKEEWIDIVLTFKAEANFNKDAVWSLWEKGLCQLLPNETNNVWINTPERSDWDYQAKICLEKWQAVKNKNKIWMAYKVRNKEKPNIKPIKTRWKKIKNSLEIVLNKYIRLLL